MGKRVLITGLATFWGGRVAQALEADPSVDVIVGLDRFEPTVELERTEYVRSDESYSILARIVKAARIDTIVHTFLAVDSTMMSSRTIHEINVIGTMNLFAAASAVGSTVRNVVVKSSTLVYGASAQDPVWFSEETRRSKPPKTLVERSLLEVEGYVRDFAVDNPHVTVAMLRFSNVLGPDITTPLAKALEMPLVPSLFGYDPRFQFVHETDVVRAILYVLENEVQGIYNVAGDGLLPWSEVAAICGRRTIPLPPYGTGILSAPLARFGVELPPELIDLLRYGRGVDNRRLKRSGFDYRFTSAGTVADFVEALRIRRTVGDEPGYQYERDVEQFFRHSPAIVRDEV
ncbi:MAG TPA: NAD-dependent epimerase/dehydratase family protein [Acidimicrobiales bacterium]|nr:NAD-dependent epimerase/dehydratase family protein [Acidimicrobiales bacterium]